MIHNTVIELINFPWKSIKTKNKKIYIYIPGIYMNMSIKYTNAYEYSIGKLQSLLQICMVVKVLNEVEKIMLYY